MFSEYLYVCSWFILSVMVKYLSVAPLAGGGHCVGLILVDGRALAPLCIDPYKACTPKNFLVLCTC